MSYPDLSAQVERLAEQLDRARADLEALTERRAERLTADIERIEESVRVLSDRLYELEGKLDRLT